jgi:hypothetical protein
MSLVKEVLRINKNQIIQFFHDGHIYLLEEISDGVNEGQNLEQFLEGCGVNSVEEFLQEEYGYESNMANITLYVKAFFSSFKAHEIWINRIYTDQETEFKTDLSKFRHLAVGALDSGDCYVLLMNENYLA